jgi:hypothetical protein
MPLPGNVSTGTVTGKFVNPDGTAVVGKVAFTPSPTALLDAGGSAVIMAGTTEATLDGTGALSVVLPATDDLDLNPQGWTYRVQFHFGPLTRFAPYSITVPAGTVRDLAAITPVPDSSGVFYLSALDIENVLYSMTGPLVVKVGTGRFYNDTGVNLSIMSVRATVAVAPTGSAVKVDVNIGGTTVFTTQANRPTIPAGSLTDLADAVNVATLPPGGYLTVDVDEVGSSTPGTDLTVNIVLTG